LASCDGDSEPAGVSPIRWKPPATCQFSFLNVLSPERAWTQSVEGERPCMSCGRIDRTEQLAHPRYLQGKECTCQTNPSLLQDGFADDELVGTGQGEAALSSQD
jgi:hypothetical protein